MKTVVNCSRNSKLISHVQHHICKSYVRSMENAIWVITALSATAASAIASAHRPGTGRSSGLNDRLIVISSNSTVFETNQLSMMC